MNKNDILENEFLKLLNILIFPHFTYVIQDQKLLKTIAVTYSGMSLGYERVNMSNKKVPSL